MPRNFDLVLRGGGIKGMAFIGSLKSLDSRKHTVRRLIGTSAGALFATAFAAGFTPNEMQAKATTRIDGKLIFQTFFNTALRPAGIPDLLWRPTASTADNTVQRLIKIIPGLSKVPAGNWGSKALSLSMGGAICDDTEFKNWIKSILTDKKIDPEINLRDFQKLISRDTPRQLSLIASNITDQAVIVMNERTAPSVPLVEAVRMSAGIPFVWKEVTWQTGWGSYLNKDITGHLIVDGGLLANFPIRYLLDSKHLAKEGVIGPLQGDEAARPLGFLLDAEKIIPDLPNARETNYLINHLPAVRIASKLLDSLTDVWDREALREFAPGDRERKLVCRIGTRGIGHLDFGLSDEQLKALINSGQCAMSEHLEYLDKNP